MNFEFAQSLLAHELQRKDCFLCRPASALLIDVAETAFAIAGLGPIVDGYSVVATVDHIRSLGNEREDMLAKYCQFATEYRAKLSRRFGSCLVTEHGNMALCDIDEARHIHCFHPHLLYFPGVREISSAVYEEFGTPKKFASLQRAIEAGGATRQYLLLSPDEDTHLIFEPKDEIPRQYARALVAESMNRESLASWRNSPGIDWAIANAMTLRRIISGAPE